MYVRLPSVGGSHLWMCRMVVIRMRMRPCERETMGSQWEHCRAGVRQVHRGVCGSSLTLAWSARDAGRSKETSQCPRVVAVMLSCQVCHRCHGRAAMGTRVNLHRAEKACRQADGSNE